MSEKDKTKPAATPVTPEAQAEHDAGFSTLEKGSGESGETELQARVDEETEQGFVGVATDERPNEDYTLKGVAGGTSRVVPDKGA